MINQNVRKTLDDVQARLPVSPGGLQTPTDLVLIMDGTASMQNLMDSAKEIAAGMYSHIRSAMALKQRIADTIRVKVIVFRDVYANDRVPFQESDFFILRADGQGDELLFRDYIASIRAEGGGDLPENALEALHMALNVDYVRSEQGQKIRQIVVMLTDAAAHELSDPRRMELMSDQTRSGLYPAGVPEDLQGLYAEWESKMDPNGRRMLVFAPNAYPWTVLSSWPDVYHVPSTAGVGIDRAEFDQVIKAIAGSMA